MTRILVEIDSGRGVIFETNKTIVPGFSGHNASMYGADMMHDVTQFEPVNYCPSFR